MQIGDYIYKNRKETSIQELALMARQMMEVVMAVERQTPGCTVERAEFIIDEKTVGWKVELTAPGEKVDTPEEKKRRVHEQIEKIMGEKKMR